MPFKLTLSLSIALLMLAPSLSESNALSPSRLSKVTFAASSSSAGWLDLEPRLPPFLFLEEAYHREGGRTMAGETVGDGRIDDRAAREESAKTQREVTRCILLVELFE
jgi:hypothetical protein